MTILQHITMTIFILIWIFGCAALALLLAGVFAGIR